MTSSATDPAHLLFSRILPKSSINFVAWLLSKSAPPELIPAFVSNGIPSRIAKIRPTDTRLFSCI
jgi:hypothetical protein